GASRHVFLLVLSGMSLGSERMRTSGPDAAILPSRCGRIKTPETKMLDLERRHLPARVFMFKSPPRPASWCGNGPALSSGGQHYSVRGRKASGTASQFRPSLRVLAPRAGSVREPRKCKRPRERPCALNI